MAAKGSGMTPARAREYLAAKAHSGDVAWKPTKPLAQYRDDQVVRKARSFQKQERAGMTPSNKNARGAHPKEISRHPTPTAPGRQAPARSPMDRLTGAYRGGRQGTTRRERSQKPRDVSMWNAQRQARAYAIIDRVARTEPNAAIRFSIKDKDGIYRSVYKHGRSAAAIADDINRSGMSFWDWILQQLAYVYGNEAVEEMFGGPGDLDVEISAELPEEEAA